MNAHAQLKAATSADHDALDAHFSSLRLDDDQDYARFLRAHAAAYLPVEAALDAAGAGTIPGWADSKRSEALLADLEAMGLDCPAPVETPDYSGAPAMLGGAYVLEGSRLGGKLLRRHLRPDQPSNFLSSRKSLAWRDFISHLEQMLGSSVECEQAAMTARATFACFAEAARVTGVRAK